MHDGPTHAEERCSLTPRGTQHLQAVLSAFSLSMWDFSFHVDLTLVSIERVKLLLARGAAAEMSQLVSLFDRYTSFCRVTSCSEQRGSR